MQQIVDQYFLGSLFLFLIYIYVKKPPSLKKLNTDIECYSMSLDIILPTRILNY